MNVSLGQLTDLRMGQTRPFARGILSAIDKQPVNGEVTILACGLAGDEQGDLRIHGGPDKAIHHYPAEHYAYWQNLPPSGIQPFQPGGFGENFSSIGMAEKDVCLGDVLQIGSAILQISQSRQPCWKLNERFQFPGLSRLVQETGLTGWYYRVIQTGTVQKGDHFVLLNRPYPDWPLTRVNRLMFASTLDRTELAALLRLPLTASWRNTLEQRLQTGKIEDWCKRLEGH